MKKLLILNVLLLGLGLCASAQIMGFSQAPATKFAQQLSDCPTLQEGYFYCPVFPSDGTAPFSALSVAGWNNGQPFMLEGQGLPGLPGKDALPPNFTAQAQTLTPGSQATASVSGSYPNLTLNLGIPTGPQGPPGVLNGSVITGSGSMFCQAVAGTVNKGFTCTFNNLTLNVTGVTAPQ